MTRQQIDRRKLLAWLGMGAAMPAIAACGFSAKAQSFRVSYTEAEWRRRLTPEEFRVLREEGTERAFTSPLNNEHRTGTFLCAGCANEIYSSATKYDSRTGWPSFYREIAGAVGFSTDYKLGYPRREVHCGDCGGHLGHVFDDGPQPTGKRHCINGVAMDFRPA
ncbi:peptide-methionine (R)-S-oxide reductase MsrB [Alteraurantiacibacter aestuarii]|uniref:peptide-methionine (R)-S-oxide reductase n=1 Tax=Alteraurantiacibacter aestuarii TaxID=650004 RepID=A0A844ZN26_9SPHN|nr:peptide-methionine (R)-S-oxide reductase MsrB [Alteraurantiacibacter aestuarii]MXO88476.1 peptide-methionine (R)-S-oxide reductase MsrB [Alteraurantiacibacter aestuarii]